MTRYKRARVVQLAPVNGRLARGTLTRSDKFAESRTMSETTKRGRFGGRGCPICGSHNTESASKANAQWCNDCGNRWSPCSAYCRGYRIDVHHEGGPTIVGCPDCGGGVPTRVARHWPEAWRALARELDGRKLEPIDGIGASIEASTGIKLPR